MERESLEEGHKNEGIQYEGNKRSYQLLTVAPFIPRLNIIGPLFDAAGLSPIAIIRYRMVQQETQEVALQHQRL